VVRDSRRSGIILLDFLVERVSVIHPLDYDSPRRMVAAVLRESRLKLLGWSTTG
jgi:hypothetical protein